MRILGIDPGYAIVGFGVLEYNSGKFTVVDYGAITTSSDMDFNRRLKVIYDDMTEIITTYKPDEMGIEKLFFNTNEKTAIDVAQARGVTLLPAIIRNIPIYEYTPFAGEMLHSRLWTCREKAGAGNDKDHASS